MENTNEKLYGVKLPSGAIMHVENKNDSERIRNAFKLYNPEGDKVAMKLASYVVYMKGEVLKNVVEMFKGFYDKQIEEYVNCCG